jgi:plasmid stabilization system protein ParE
LLGHLGSIARYKRDITYARASRQFDPARTSGGNGAEPAAGFRLIDQSSVARDIMPRGDKSKYTDKQERQADHIAESYESRGVREGEAERRAWATVNKETGGGKKSGAGRGHAENHAPSRKGGRLGAAASAAAKKAAATRKRRAK